MRARTAAWSVGSSTGTWARLCGKFSPCRSRPRRRGVPGNGAGAQQLAGGFERRVGRRGAVGQHGIELVQGQLAQQRLELALVAQQAQVRLVQHGL